MNSELLGNEKVSKLLLRFAIPAIVGMIVNALYNIVDRIFVGQGVGPLGIAGITIGFPISLIIMAFAMLIGVGATSLISIKLGENNKEEAETILGNGMTLLFAISLIISVTGIVFLNPLLKAFGASTDVLPYAVDYMYIILLGTGFQAVGFGMNNFIRAEGNPKAAMITMLIGAIANTVLDPIFIFIFGMGIKGAAIATIISQAISAVWVLAYFFSKKSLLRVHMKNLNPQMNIVLKITAIGMAPFSMQLVASLITTILNKSLAFYGGDIAISGIGIINSLALLIMMPLFGINQGAQPIIGFNYGAKKFDRVKETLKLAILAATVIVTLGFIVAQLFPYALVNLFNSTDQNLIEFTVHAMRIFLIFLPIIGFQIVSASYFQAVGKPKAAMILSLSRQLIIFLPALIILPRFFELNGVLYSGPVSDLISSIITGIWIYKELKHLEDRHQDTFVYKESPIID